MNKIKIISNKKYEKFVNKQGAKIQFVQLKFSNIKLEGSVERDAKGVVYLVPACVAEKALEHFSNLMEKINKLLDSEKDELI